VPTTTLAPTTTAAATAQLVAIPEYLALPDDAPPEVLRREDLDVPCTADIAGPRSVAFSDVGDDSNAVVRNVTVQCAQVDGEWRWAVALDHAPVLETRQAVLACADEFVGLISGGTADSCAGAWDLLQIEGGDAAFLVRREGVFQKTSLTVQRISGDLDETDTDVIVQALEMMESYATA
jgi:hypothetical protein